MKASRSRVLAAEKNHVKQFVRQIFERRRWHCFVRQHDVLGLDVSISIHALPKSIIFGRSKIASTSFDQAVVERKLASGKCERAWIHASQQQRLSNSMRIRSSTRRTVRSLRPTCSLISPTL